MSMWRRLPKARPVIAFPTLVEGESQLAQAEIGLGPGGTTHHGHVYGQKASADARFVVDQIEQAGRLAMPVTVNSVLAVSLSVAVPILKSSVTEGRRRGKSHGS